MYNSKSHFYNSYSLMTTFYGSGCNAVPPNCRVLNSIVLIRNLFTENHGFDHQAIELFFFCSFLFVSDLVKKIHLILELNRIRFNLF